MGLFSFLKNVGSKVFNKAEETAPKTEENTAPTSEIIRQHKASLLKGIVEGLGIEVKELSLDLVDDSVIIYGEVESQADKEKVILAVGNVEGVATVDDRMTVVTPEPEAVFYEVQKGDTLSKIAKAHYGDWRRYPEIFEANQPMLKDPDLIYPGQMLRIPGAEA